MSSQYTAEPPMEGGITLHTTHGALHIRLWPRDAPGAVRAFVQLALDGRYTGVPFHRIVPGLLVQTGDTSLARYSQREVLLSSGSPSPSFVGLAPPVPLRAERNARLKFRRRALVAMVADDGQDDGDKGDGSRRPGEERNVGRNKNPASSESERMIQDQFFITLAEAPFLNGQHPIIGTVVGNSVFNLLNIASSHGGVTGDDGDGDALKSAMNDMPRITRVEVTENPFPEMRKTIHMVEHGEKAGDSELKGTREGKEQGRGRGRGREHVDARRAVRSDRLLSFRTADDGDLSEEGGEDDNDNIVETDNIARGERLSTVPPRRKRVRPATEVSLLSTTSSSGDVRGNVSKTVAQSTQVIPASGPVTLSPVSPATPSQPISKQPSQKPPGPQSQVAASAPPPTSTGENEVTTCLIEAANAEFEALRQELMSNSDAAKNITPNDNNDGNPTSPLQNEGDKNDDPKQRTSKRRRSRKAEEEMLARLRAFEARLMDSRKANASGLSNHGATTSGTAWFARGLKLRPPSDDERDYEVVDNAPRTRTPGQSRPSKR